VATAITSSPRHVVAWMDEVLDALDIEHAPLVGSSFGAWMAMHYCLARPQRLARLAMLAPAGIVGSPRFTWHQRRQDSDLAQRDEGTEDARQPGDGKDPSTVARRSVAAHRRTVQLWLAELSPQSSGAVSRHAV
jgi:pimeloyl-ACP methyl ester carboxylesterase